MAFILGGSEGGGVEVGIGEVVPPSMLLKHLDGLLLEQVALGGVLAEEWLASVYL